MCSNYYRCPLQMASKIISFVHHKHFLFILQRIRLPYFSYTETSTKSEYRISLVRTQSTRSRRFSFYFLTVVDDLGAPSEIGSASSNFFFLLLDTSAPLFCGISGEIIIIYDCYFIYFFTVSK